MKEEIFYDFFTGEPVKVLALPNEYVWANVYSSPDGTMKIRIPSEGPEKPSNVKE